jgi:hypothetical protein
VNENPGGAALDSAAPRQFGIGDFVLWALLAIVSCVPIIFDLTRAHGLVMPQGNLIGRDFLNAWAGGRLAFEGQVHDIYLPARYLDQLQGLLGFRTDFHAFSYPPTLLLFLWPFGLIAYLPALLIWIVVTGAAFIAAARHYLKRDGVPIWLAALLPAGFVNIWAGHHGFIFSALWLAAFASITKRPAVAGLLIALLTLKPHMGALVALLLVIRGEWRTIGWAALGSLALVAASVAAFGVEPWVNYFRFIAPLQADLLSQTAGEYLRMMPTPYVSFWVASHSMLAAVAAQILFAAAGLALLVRAALRHVPWPELGLMASTATFLVLPYAFNYDMEVVGIGAALLLYGKSGQLDPAGRLAALLVLAAPFFVFVMNIVGLPLLPFALLYFLWVQAKCYSGEGGAKASLEPAGATSA